VTDDDTYEIVTFREDVGKGRRPDEVKFSTIDKDVLRRDLTINALFYDLDTKEIVDLVGGISDLEKGIIRTVGPAEDRFNEDKLRIIRALRFAGRIGSDVDEDIDKAIKKDNSIISGDGKPLAQERIQDEFVKGIKQAKSPKQFVDMVKRYGLLRWVFHDMDTSGEIVNSKSPLVVIASLLRNETGDIDKKLTGRLKFTKLMGKQIKFMVEFFRNGTPDTAYTFKEKIKSLGIDGSVLHDFGRVMGMDKSFIKAFNKFEITVDGGELANQGFKGKELGDEKTRIETENFKMLMGKSTINYSGIILDGESHNRLIGLLHEHFQDIDDWVEHSHHMTITLGPLPMKFRGLIGQDFNVTVTDIGHTKDVVAVKVDTSFDVYHTPHITLATSPSGKPDMSNMINNWVPTQPFNVTGILEEIPH
jgi:hypothetical protein